MISVVENRTTVRQHCRDMFRMEGDSRDKRRTDDVNGRKIAGIQHARSQRPTCSHNPVEHRIGGATDMGGDHQCRPPQDCHKV